MIRVRKPFSVFMSVFYMWALLTPLVLGCPCDGHKKAPQPPVPACHACCSGEARARCAQTERMACHEAKAQTDKSEGCCNKDTGCKHCPRCLVIDAVSPSADRLTTNTVTIQSATPVSLVDVFVSTDYSLLVDHPPDQSRVAPHISTAVLRC